MKEPLNETKSFAILCGWSIPAYSVIHSIRVMDWRGQIVCLKDRHDGPVLVEQMNPKVQTIITDFHMPEDLFTFIDKSFPRQDKKYVFFFDERFHPVLVEKSKKTFLENTLFFPSAKTHIDPILDRYEFYRFIDNHRAGPVPYTILGNEEPWTAFKNGFILRPRRTWKGLQKLDRVKLIRNPKQLNVVLQQWERHGLDDKDWCFQEILSFRPQDNVSISGWHDPENPLYFATRHILRHPTNVGNGDVTELIKAPASLVERTARILDALSFTGPFELEYLLDIEKEIYKPIELNPRFWMQHGLIEALTDHELVRRYLGIKPSGCSINKARYRYWVYTFYSVFRLLRGDLRCLRYLKNPASVREPNLSTALKWIPAYLLQKLTARRKKV